MTTRPRSWPDCPPRYATARRPNRATYGPVVAELATAMGGPLMPWQRQVADVALEVDGRTGRLAYRQVVFLTPRQSGKTRLTLPVMTHRALAFGGHQRIGFTMQSRADARMHWEDTQLPLLESSPLAPLFKVRRRTGAEGLLWRTGSIFSLLSPTEQGGHGKTLDLVVADEGWALDAALEQAISPTQITRPEPQTWVPSTAGTVRSEWLRGKVDTGRAQCRTRRSIGTTCYFEWSADPDADPGDPGTWWATMPALGHTITEAAIRAEYERLDLADFRRAYLNQWPDEMALDEWAVIPQADWTALADPRSTMVGPVAMALDMTPERSVGSIAAAGRRPDGRMHVELVDHRPGVAWIADRARELAELHRPCVLLVDAGGPAGSLIPSLEAKELRVTSPTMREVAQATGAFIDACAVDAASVRHLGQGPLDVAVAGARLRTLGDASAWARRGPSVAIAPLVACTLAAAGHARYAPLAERPPLYVVDAG